MQLNRKKVLAFRVREKEKVLFKELAEKMELRGSELFRLWLNRELRKERML